MITARVVVARNTRSVAGGNMSDTVIYISGPMTGIPEFNYPAFEQMFQTLVSKGISVQSPHKVGNAPFNDPGEAWLWYMKQSINMLLSCNTILMLQGWENSKGAVLEKTIAENLKYPIYYSIRVLFENLGFPE